jgi:hypothetical protein
VLAIPSVRGIRRVRRAVRIVFGAGGAGLVAFHGWLLASQFADGRLLDPGLAFRWLLAGALVASLVALQRSGASLWDRKGIAIWVLATLLHGPAIAAESGKDAGVLALPEAVATVVVQLAATSGSLALGLWILGRVVTESDRRFVPHAAPLATARHRLADPHRRPFSPRPPPSVFAD